MWAVAVAALMFLPLGATTSAGTAAPVHGADWTIAQLAPHTPPPGARRPTGSVGIALKAVDGGISVVEVMPGGPGARAGIAAGDVLLRIDGQSVAGVPLPDVARKIAGPAGTSVRLDVRHPDGREVTLEIVRRPLGGPPSPPPAAPPKDPSPGGPAPRSDEGDATCRS